MQSPAPAGRILSYSFSEAKQMEKERLGRRFYAVNGRFLAMGSRDVIGVFPCHIPRHCSAAAPPRQIHRLSTSARLQTRQRAWALSHSHPPFRAAISPGKLPASCKTSICLRNFWAYVDRMDWQQPASLLVVFIAFILMVRGLFGRRVSCASGAGCCGSGSGKGVFPRSTTFRARKGQRPEMVIKR